jgi:hypothetical protein
MQTAITHVGGAQAVLLAGHAGIQEGRCMVLAVVGQAVSCVVVQ